MSRSMKPQLSPGWPVKEQNDTPSSNMDSTLENGQMKHWFCFLFSVDGSEESAREIVTDIEEALGWVAMKHMENVRLLTSFESTIGRQPECPLAATVNEVCNGTCSNGVSD